MIEKENIYSFSVGLKAFIENDNGEILIIKRSQNVAKPGLYDIPGGRMRIGETVREGLIREINEEIGLKITKVYSPLSMGTFIRDIDKTNQIVRIIFHCKATGRIKLDKSEADESKWIKPSEYIHYKFCDEYYAVAFRRFNACKDLRKEFLFEGAFRDSLDLLNSLKQ